MHTTFSRLSPTIVMAILAMPVLMIGQTAERSRTQGLKETDQFVKASETTSQAITNGKMELQKTLGAYNTLVTQPSKDMKGDYKKLLKSSDSMNAKVASAQQKIEAMQKSGDTYFSGRAETIKGIVERRSSRKRIRPSRRGLRISKACAPRPKHRVEMRRVATRPNVVTASAITTFGVDLPAPYCASVSSPPTCSLTSRSDTCPISSSRSWASTRPNKSRRRATVPVHPVWWLAPSPAPLSPWKYS